MSDYIPPPEPGIYPGVRFSEYRRWDAVNNSLLWTLKTKTPYHAKFERDNPKKETPALAFGRALHSMILEPAKFPEEYAVRPKINRCTKAGKEEYAKWLAESEGKAELTEKDMADLAAMKSAVSSKQMVETISGGRAEVSIVWEDKKTGLICKGRIDYERTDGWNHYITDLKSCEAAGFRPFQKAIVKYGYYQGMAFYHDGWQTLTGESSLCLWLAVEKSPPFATKLWEAEEDLLEAGRNSYRSGLERYAQCLKSGEWPGHGDVELINLPEWCLLNEGVNKYEVKHE